MSTPSAPDTPATKPTNPVCAIVRGSFEAYRREAMPTPQRRMLREHLLACEACRGAAAMEDPTFRFARPFGEGGEVSEDATREILSAVMTGVDLLKAERRIRGAESSRRLRMGSAAAAAVAAAVLVSTGWGILQSPPSPARAAASASAAVPESSAASLAPAASSSAQTSDPSIATALQPAALSEEAPAPSSDATVYDWNPGAGREEPRVVWIVDRGLDI